ncbi:MAG: hypothetical protein F9K29_18125 [Hyphomicrobiaceae bacterium]|nr:MAG: hypothetical protein F9K29_18125 [Hyphomicrobiaceae bacterium]
MLATSRGERAQLHLETLQFLGADNKALTGAASIAVGRLATSWAPRFRLDLTLGARVDTDNEWQRRIWSVGGLSTLLQLIRLRIAARIPDPMMTFMLESCEWGGSGLWSLVLLADVAAEGFTVPGHVLRRGVGAALLVNDLDAKAACRQLGRLVRSGVDVDGALGGGFEARWAADLWSWGKERQRLAAQASTRIAVDPGSRALARRLIWCHGSSCESTV